MSQIDYEALDAQLITVLLEAHGFGKLTAATPMHEIRSLAEQAGEVYGRVAAAIEQSKPETSALDLDIEDWQQFGKEQMLRAVEVLFAPGGCMREYLIREGALR